MGCVQSIPSENKSLGPNIKELMSKEDKIIRTDEVYFIYLF
jgi:hypothetical protein